jgi:hypothetical protein
MRLTAELILHDKVLIKSPTVETTESNPSQCKHDHSMIVRGGFKVKVSDKTVALENKTQTFSNICKKTSRKHFEMLRDIFVISTESRQNLYRTSTEHRHDIYSEIPSKLYQN